VSPHSPTQRLLEPRDVVRILAASFDPGPLVVTCAPLDGGGFAAVWRARLGDGKDVVLKVGPAPPVPLLRYERDLIAAEARCFRLVAELAPDVPVPVVLHHGTDRAVLDSDWLVTSALPGQTLRSLTLAEPNTDDAPVRVQAGAAMAALHGITGFRYGYDGGRTGADTWTGAFNAIVGDLLADAVDWNVDLPIGADHIEEAIELNLDALAVVARPALVYFDGWDGNLLVQPGPDGQPQLCGLVDGERFLYGDPLMDLVTAAMYRRIESEPEHPFLRGYAGYPMTFDTAAERRLALYRMHLYLLMLVEMPSRGMTGQAFEERWDRLAAHLTEQVSRLRS
jgi:aminoglycoside phosphotransferase (APT) family kinase protein